MGSKSFYKILGWDAFKEIRTKKDLESLCHYGSPIKQAIKTSKMFGAGTSFRIKIHKNKMSGYSMGDVRMRKFFLQKLIKYSVFITWTKTCVYYKFDGF